MNKKMNRADIRIQLENVKRHLLQHIILLDAMSDDDAEMIAELQSGMMAEMGPLCQVFSRVVEQLINERNNEFQKELELIKSINREVIAKIAGARCKLNKMELMPLYAFIDDTARDYERFVQPAK